MPAPRDGLAAERDGATRWALEAAHDPQQRRLAAAVGPEHDPVLAALHPPGYVVEDGRPLAQDAQAVDVQDRGAGGHHGGHLAWRAAGASTARGPGRASSSSGTCVREASPRLYVGTVASRLASSVLVSRSPCHESLSRRRSSLFLPVVRAARFHRDAGNAFRRAGRVRPGAGRGRFVRGGGLQRGEPLRRGRGGPLRRLPAGPLHHRAFAREGGQHRQRAGAGEPGGGAGDRGVRRDRARPDARFHRDRLRGVAGVGVGPFAGRARGGGGHRREAGGAAGGGLVAQGLRRGGSDRLPCGDDERASRRGAVPVVLAFSDPGGAQPSDGGRARRPGGDRRCRGLAVHPFRQPLEIRRERSRDRGDPPGQRARATRPHRRDFAGRPQRGLSRHRRPELALQPEAALPRHAHHGHQRHPRLAGQRTRHPRQGS